MKVSDKNYERFPGYYSRDVQWNTHLTLVKYTSSALQLARSVLSRKVEKVLSRRKTRKSILAESRAARSELRLYTSTRKTKVIKTRGSCTIAEPWPRADLGVGGLAQNWNSILIRLTKRGKIKRRNPGKLIGCPRGTPNTLRSIVRPV